MKTNTSPRCRWFRFSLRTLLVLVTLVCIYLGWAMNWIRQREAYLQTSEVRSVSVIVDQAVAAPWSLRILGENGIPYLMHWNAEAGELIEVSRLFPEARVLIFKLDKDGVVYRTNLPDIYHTAAREDFPYYQDGVLLRSGLLEAVGESE